MCKLENGLDANIHENDADFFQGGGPGERSVEIGSIITGRLHEIKFGDKGKDLQSPLAAEDNFSVTLKCKQ